MDVDETLSKHNIHKKVVLRIEDTEIKPDVAVAKVKKLVDQGIRIIIGPQTSSELKEIKKYTDQHDVLIISQLVIPIWRNDQYGNELYNITKAKFQNLGGNFSNNGVKYDPHVGEFAGSLHRINFITWDQKLKALDLAVNNARNLLGHNSYSKIGIYVISYGEVVPLLIQSSFPPRPV